MAFLRWPVGAHFQPMSDHRNLWTKLRWLFVLPLGALCVVVVSGGVFIAGAHARYALIQATSLTIEAPEQVSAGETFTVSIRATGFPFGAGVDLYVGSVRDREGIHPIGRGWNDYRLVAPAEPGHYDLSASLYAEAEGTPGVCAIITATQTIWMPPSKICLSGALDVARGRIEVVSDT